MKSMEMNKVGKKQKRLPFPQLVQIKTELKVDTAVETARNNVLKVQIILAIEMYKMTQTSEARYCFFISSKRKITHYGIMLPYNQSGDDFALNSTLVSR